MNTTEAKADNHTPSLNNRDDDNDDDGLCTNESVTNNTIHENIARMQNLHSEEAEDSESSSTVALLLNSSDNMNNEDEASPPIISNIATTNSSMLESIEDTTSVGHGGSRNHDDVDEHNLVEDSNDHVSQAIITEEETNSGNELLSSLLSNPGRTATTATTATSGNNSNNNFSPPSNNVTRSRITNFENGHPLDTVELQQTSPSSSSITNNNYSTYNNIRSNRRRIQRRNSFPPSTLTSQSNFRTSLHISPRRTTTTRPTRPTAGTANSQNASSYEEQYLNYISMTNSSIAASASTITYAHINRNSTNDNPPQRILRNTHTMPQHNNNPNNNNSTSNNSYSLFHGLRGIPLPPDENNNNSYDSYEFVSTVSDQSLRTNLHRNRNGLHRSTTGSHDDNENNRVNEVTSNTNENNEDNNPTTNNNNNTTSNNTATVQNNNEDRNMSARMTWILINRRLQMIIKVVKASLTFIFLGILICWFVFTAEYVVSFDEEECESDITRYYWLATFLLFHDVFRNEILRYFLCWNARLASRTRHVPPRIYVFNLLVMTYAIIVLKLGVTSTFIRPLQGDGDENDCVSISLLNAARAHVLFTGMAWFLIVFGYVIPLIIAFILLTRNGYVPGSDGSAFDHGGTGQFGGVISFSTSNGAPLGTVDAMKTVEFEDLSEEHPGECCICMGDFSPNDEIVLTECNHVFHKSCCEEWLNHARTCPVCRHDIPSTLNLRLDAITSNSSTNEGTVTEMFGRRGFFPPRQNYQSTDSARQEVNAAIEAIRENQRR